MNRIDWVLWKMREIRGWMFCCSFCHIASVKCSKMSHHYNLFYSMQANFLSSFFFFQFTTSNNMLTLRPSHVAFNSNYLVKFAHHDAQYLIENIISYCFVLKYLYSDHSFGRPRSIHSVLSFSPFELVFVFRTTNIKWKTVRRGFNTDHRKSHKFIEIK